MPYPHGMPRRPRHVRVLRLALALAVLAIPLAACGDDGDDAATTAASTTAAATTAAPVPDVDPVDLLAGIPAAPLGPTAVRARLSVEVRGEAGDDPATALLLTGPVEVAVDGRSGGADGTLDLRVQVRAGAFSIPLDVRADGERVYLRYGGTWYVLDPATDTSPLAALAGSLDPGRALAAVGDPSAWLVDPQVVAAEDVQGVPATHVSAGLDVAALAGLAVRIADAAQSAGLSGQDPLSDVDRAALARGVRTGTADLWVGEDGALRRAVLDLDLDLDAIGDGTTTTGGIEGVAVKADVSALPADPPVVEAPADPRPIAELGGVLGGLLGAGAR